MDPYKELEIESCSTEHEIKIAYQKALLLHHPDKQRNENSTSSVEKFLSIQEAWKILTDKDKKLKYDMSVKVEDAKFHGAETININQFEQSDGEVETESGESVYCIVYTKSCRCGDIFEISSIELDDGFNTLQCDTCCLCIVIEYIG